MSGVIIFFLAYVAFVVLVYWKVFEKAGRPGWEFLIPIYNLVIMMKIIGKPWWWLLVMCVPIVNVVFIIWSLNMLSKSFGKDEGFTVGLVLVNLIFLAILAFGDAKYLGPYGDPVAFAAGQQPHFDFDAPQPA
jgi:hypothetical protein